jgi:hypothetical protein
MFISASWELPGFGSEKLKQIASFQGKLFGERKAPKANLE